MSSRDSLYSRLRHSLSQTQSEIVAEDSPPPRGELIHRLQDPKFRLQRFKEILLSQKTEIIDYPQEYEEQKRIWKDIFYSEDEVISRIAYSSQTSFHSVVNEVMEELSSDTEFIKKRKVLYTDRERGYLATKAAKLNFLDFQVGITEVEVGLADTGSLLLIPSREEPRALSLVPPIHIAVMSQKKILPDLQEFFSQRKSREHNSNPFPSSNWVLISGPSKTADIEKRLVHGVHGPRRLILLLSS